MDRNSTKKHPGISGRKSAAYSLGTLGAEIISSSCAWMKRTWFGVMLHFWFAQYRQIAWALIFISSEPRTR